MHIKSYTSALWALQSKFLRAPIKQKLQGTNEKGYLNVHNRDKAHAKLPNHEHTGQIENNHQLATINHRIYYRATNNSA